MKLEGEQVLERARQRVANNLSRATLRVEERAGALEKAQHQLAELRSGTQRAEKPPVERDIRVVAPVGDAESGQGE